VTFTLTKKHILALFLLCLFIAFSFAWLFTDTLSWLYGAGAFVVLVAAIVLWSINKEEPAVKRQALLEKQDRQLVKKLFQVFMQELKDRGQNKHKYRIPWYLFISHDTDGDQKVLSQMGFRNSSVNSIGQQLPIQIWLKNDAIILVVEMSSKDYRPLNCLKLLIKQVKSYRARQSLNGIICSQSIAYLLNNDKNHTQQMANDNRLVINEIQRLCGQQLPIYVVFNQMAGLADFCQFFASLNENKLEGALGALNNDKVQAGEYQTRWFNKVYDDICQRMGHAVISALDSQLNESFRRSAVAAPIQFKQVKPEVSYFLAQLFLSEKTKSNYLFRGFFFSNAEQNFTATDPLTKQVAYQLSFNEMLKGDDVKLSHSIFVSHFFDGFIRPEAAMAGINKKVKRLFWGFQISYVLIMISIISTVLLLLKANYDYYQPLNAETLVALNHYKAQVKKEPYDLAELASNVSNLAIMQNIYRTYNRETPFYISKYIPNPSINSAVQQAYHDELSNVLLPSMVHYLSDELFVYETLGDPLKIAQLLQLNEELVLHDEASWKHLKSYYQESFIKEDQTDSKTLANLVSLMSDLYDLGLPEVKLNTTLIAQAKASLVNTNSTQVLFDYIKGLPQFNLQTDISSDLGNNFDQLFKAQKNASIALVPYLYTPEGFASIDLSQSSELFGQVVSNNKALLGHKLNPFEKNNLSKSLQRYYQRSYVNFWLAFINNISFKHINSDTFAYHISLLTNASDSPFSQFYQAIAYYTHPNVISDNKTKTAAEQASDLVAKAASIVGQNVGKNAMAKAIQAEFSSYHNFIKQDEKGESELTRIQEKISAVHQWLQEANNSNIVGAFYFNQLTSNRPNQSLSQLTGSKISIEMISKEVQVISNFVNQTVMTSMRTYVNQLWEKQIIEVYEDNFVGKFPFDTSSQRNVNFKALNSFFKKSGTFSQFKKQYLHAFSQGDNQLVLKGFVTGTNLVVDGAIYESIENITKLQSALYQESPEKFSIKFKLKPQSMSASLLTFELFSDRTLLTYQHGPKLWQEFSWPATSEQMALLTIFTDVNQMQTTTSYPGQWAWLRLIYQNYSDDVVIGEEGNLMTIHDKKNQMSFLLSVTSDENPLHLDFFKRINLSQTLL
jgi:type VI secretion system IcmF/VasK family protein